MSIIGKSMNIVSDVAMIKEQVKLFIDANVWDGEDRSGCKDGAGFTPDELQELVNEMIDHLWEDEDTKEGEQLKNPEEWAAEMDMDILDPDGWRFDHLNCGLKAKSFSEKITKQEFNTRMIFSTIIPF